MRAHLRRAKRSKAAAIVQALGRGYGARRRAEGLHQIDAREKRDERVAAMRAQNVLRALLARHAVARMRLRKQRLDELRDHAARRVVKFMRLALGQGMLARLRKALEKKRRLQNGAALIMERCTRGLFGRQRARRRKKFVAMINARATVIERHWRGSRVLHWRHLRMNFVARHVLDRQDFERARREAGVRGRFAAWQHELAKDSCSDSDGDAGGQLDDAWVERKERDGRTTWFHTGSGEVSTHDPRCDPVDAELIGCSVRVYWPLEDDWFEGTLARFHRRKRKYRLEYHDGDHEWLNLDENQDRLQLFDATGSWADFGVAVRPALLERLQKQTDAAELRRKARSLEEETRAWEVLPNDDEESVFDDESSSQRFKEETPPQRERWMNRLTGELRFLSDEAMWWVESRDDADNFCFEHGETGEVVYHDPRFAKDVDPPNVREWKAACLEKLRPAVYLTSHLIEKWDGNQDVVQGKKARSEVLKKILESTKTTVFALKAEVMKARDLWTPEDFEADAELSYAAYVLKRLNDLEQIAETEREKNREAKRKLLANSKRFRGVWCRSCRHKCMDQQATHCPTCGVRFDARGTIMVGDVGAASFEQASRASRTSKAGLDTVSEFETAGGSATVVTEMTSGGADGAGEGSDDDDESSSRMSFRYSMSDFNRSSVDGADFRSSVDSYETSG